MKPIEIVAAALLTPMLKFNHFRLRIVLISRNAGVGVGFLRVALLPYYKFPNIHLKLRYRGSRSQFSPNLRYKYGLLNDIFRHGGYGYPFNRWYVAWNKRIIKRCIRSCYQLIDEESDEVKMYWLTLYFLVYGRVTMQKKTLPGGAPESKLYLFWP